MSLLRLRVVGAERVPDWKRNLGPSRANAGLTRAAAAGVTGWSAPSNRRAHRSLDVLAGPTEEESTRGMDNRRGSRLERRRRERLCPDVDERGTHVREKNLRSRDASSPITDGRVARSSFDANDAGANAW